MDAIRMAVGTGNLTGLRLKWPNDVLVGNAKCAGVLSESYSKGDASGITAVIGVGVNLVWHPTDLGRPATHLAAHAAHVEPTVMLCLLAETMERWLGVWNGGAGFGQVRIAWLHRAGPLGEALTIDTGNERIEGTFLGLDSDGLLVVRDQNNLQRRLTFGDVTVASPGPRGHV